MMNWLEIGVIVVAIYWLANGPFKHGRPKGAGDGAWAVQ